MPDRDVERLGVEILPSDHANIVGIGGEVLPVRYGTVDFVIARPGIAYRWSATVAFYTRSRAILGHSGFLEDFTATFNGLRRHVTLTPNGTAPGPTAPSA